MPFRKKALYYGIMLLLTLLALEGMARLAYYAAYGSWYGGGGLSGPANPASLTPVDVNQYHQIRHPFYGFANPWPVHALNAPLPWPRQEDTILIGLLGGSVAEQVDPYFQRELNRWFAANGRPLRPAVLRLATGAQKQPQQTLIVANILLQSGEFDLIVNMDGFNELNGTLADNFQQGVFPFYPDHWPKLVSLTAAELALAGRIDRLRREQARGSEAAPLPPTMRSAWFGLVNRYRQERMAARIIQLNHALAAAAAGYTLEKHGPRSWLEREGELLPAAARVWYRSSVILHRLAELAGADYYHFLQPNQYVPGAKPLSAQERQEAYAPGSYVEFSVGKGYPPLRAFNQALQGQGINYFDLTGVFADHPETLYNDKCCHLNRRGYELLAAAMVRRMEPSLWRLGAAGPAAPVSALAAARRPAELNVPPAALQFQVSFAEDGKTLRYVRESCEARDTVAEFFLHLIPRDWADLPPHRQEDGFDHWGFSFARAEGRLDQGQCRAQIPLPDYPLAALRTGQRFPGRGNLWSVELVIPADPAQLRAEYAALAAAKPAARAAFDLYVRDNQLIYLRETCAAADTAADFFLHLIPENPADLPEERRAAGFAHSGFAFARRGGLFDGRCLAAISLPDYPIAAIRTGQYIPDQGDLWSVDLTVAPDPEQLRADYAALAGVQPAARAIFDLYVADNRLLYLRESCAAADTTAGFFLHIIPADRSDLPEDRQEAGFAHRDFAFGRWGGPFDGKCLAAVPLPDYPVREMRTGQQLPGQGDLWSVALIAAPDYDQLRADYAALSAAQPAARDYFALYWQDNRLLYLRETCAVADTAADFFLHIVPEDIADLPPERQAAGFANSGFAFARQGGLFDGKCLAAVPLPDYPIAAMRTGQYIPGQGDLWSVELRAAP